MSGTREWGWGACVFGTSPPVTLASSFSTAVPSQCLLEFASLLKFVRERIDATSGSGASVPPSPAVTPAGTPAAPTLGRQRSIRDVLGQQSRCVKRCVTPSVLMLFDGQPFLIRCSCLVSLACGRYLLHFNGGTDSYVTVGLTCQLFPSAPPNRSPICFVLLFADTLFPHHTSGEGPGCATPLDRRVLGASRGTRGFGQAQAHPSRSIIKGPCRYSRRGVGRWWCQATPINHPNGCATSQVSLMPPWAVATAAGTRATPPGLTA
jgi:hypothetical protein